MYIKDDN